MCRSHAPSPGFRGRKDHYATREPPRWRQATAEESCYRRVRHSHASAHRESREEILSAHTYIEMPVYGIVDMKNTFFHFSFNLERISDMAKTCMICGCAEPSILDKVRGIGFAFKIKE